MTTLTALRQSLRAAILADQSARIAALTTTANLTPQDRTTISTNAAALIRQVRAAGRSGLTEIFLAEYGLSTDEGVALMCLAEALLRVPDTDTIDALIEDKIAPSDWGRHLGKSSSSLVNASTWALLLTGKVLDKADTNLAGTLRKAIKRLGEPVIRTAVRQAMKELGSQFVLGRDIKEATENAARMQAQGYTYSYDMLGEAAKTEGDARRYHLSYSDAITALAKHCTSPDIRANPGISVKLSALHPRYEVSQRQRVLDELVPRALSLALLAKSAGMGFNIDAEEADRLDLSLDVIEAILSNKALSGWYGFGVVVQAYGPRAAFTLDWLHALASKLDRRIMVRLVKGAYWDTEIKRAQTLGLPGYPVFTRKDATDISYIANARKLLGMTDRIYPQFATHNAHSVAAILHMAGDRDAFEFQRLHGMGEALHDAVLTAEKTRCRIYAPVGAHRDLLAYLVRRLLENGANSSFVNQIVDVSVAPETIAADPFANFNEQARTIPMPREIYAPRLNSTGHDLTDTLTLAELESARQPFRTHRWRAGADNGTKPKTILNPADPDDIVGEVFEATQKDLENALRNASMWRETAQKRAKILRQAANLYEQTTAEFFALLARESGKSLPDCESELREAVDFLRFYADEAERLNPSPRGIFACISPWNFPLAIFTGQIAAALAAGNAVIAKPADQTPLIAHKAVQLLHQAGVPATALHLLCGSGITIGAPLAADPRIAGIAFTGSTATAQRINRAMAATGSPSAPLIAETGGINAMIVDSTALPEQAVRDIVASAFQSAGQRCSALRMLYLQADIAPHFLEMLSGAMQELRLGDPWLHATDIGPVIDETARAKIQTHIDIARREGRILAEQAAPKTGTFIAPTLIRVSGIADLKDEIFGPVLHAATFEANGIDRIADAINASGYGLTFGLHSRIDGRVQRLVERVKAGNIYVNRNQIGAIVGSQPFGGENLSGTGPKAGGPHYLARFAQTKEPTIAMTADQTIDSQTVQSAINNLTTTTTAQSATNLPGPTGESNRLSTFPRGIILCLGPDVASATAQAKEAQSSGCPAIVIAPGMAKTTSKSVISLDGILPPEALTTLHGFAAIAFWNVPNARSYRAALAQRNGPIIPLVTSQNTPDRYLLERHLCIDTTAAGGNASLLAGN